MFIETSCKCLGRLQTQQRDIRRYTVAAPRALLNDVVATAAIALFWAGSGYFNACSYVMAATWAPAGAKERAGGIMALVFQVSCLLALLLATGLQRILFKVSI